jgi:polysaccharide biosynthesis protein PslA
MYAFRPPGFDRFAFVHGDLLLRPISFSTSVATGISRGHAIVKRSEDIAVALGLLAVLVIPMLLVGLSIRLTGDGPALFHQVRIGLNGRRFVMLKFRTMHKAAENRTGCRQATRFDPRVTRLGAFLRRTSMDELPQLLNVLTGSMSMVGPRPHAPGTCAAGRPFEHVTHHYAERHCVKPGMTGLAQVRGWRGETDTEEKLLRRLDSDLEYIAAPSIRADLMILCRTTLAVMRMLNAY